MECGCTPPNLGGNLANTCGSTLLFMALLNSFLTNKCDISEICERVSSQETPNLEYDYVVIGGGSGGSVAAGRLVDQNMGTVLLLEAGGDEPVGTQVPSMILNYFDNPDVDWMYHTEPEPVGCQGYPEKRCDWKRGKVLGGSGVINGMMYIRGVPKDYDKWAEAGNEGWSYKECLRAFKAQEDNLQIGTLVDAEFHGKGGPLTVAQFPYHPEFADDILAAGKELGYNAGVDLNGKDLTGFTIAQTNNRNGTRLSAARAYLRPIRNNSNFHVMLHTLATKIIVQNVNGKKKATGVHFERAEKPYKVRVRKEVILACGTINSPQVLLLSGIGPKEDLQQLGINVVHDLPGVGKNLQNHVSFDLSFNLKKTINYNELNWAQVMNYILKREGPMSSTGMSQVTARANSKYADPSGDYPDLQLFFSGYMAHCSATGEVRAVEDPDHPEAPKTVGISPVNLHPKSIGSIKLKSKNPYDPPLMYGNYLTEPEDMKILLEAIRLALNISKTNLLTNKYQMELIKEDYGDCNKYTFDSDEYWSCAVKLYTNPENHQVGTCKMGPDSDPNAVVNNKLQVKGIPNLRILDASVIPHVPSGNTAAGVMMLAYRGIEFIKEDQSAPLPTLDNRNQIDQGPTQGHGQQPLPRPGIARPIGQVGNNRLPQHGPYQYQAYFPPYNYGHSIEFHNRHPDVPNPFEQQGFRSH